MNLYGKTISWHLYDWQANTGLAQRVLWYFRQAQLGHGSQSRHDAFLYDERRDAET